MNDFHLHMVSDSTGETVNVVARSALAQLDEVRCREHVWSLVRTKGQMQRVLEGIDANPGIVLYTIVDPALRDMLRQKCFELRIPCMSAISKIVSEIASYAGVQISDQPGKQHQMNEEYFSRMEAINYTLAHDDGQNHWELDEADIVLVGVSRTSKSPTCIYLSNRGYRTANVPYVTNCPLPPTLDTLQRPLVVGLTIDPERLVQIRKSRLTSLDENRETSYVDMEAVKAEIAEARRYYSKHRWPVIDVTRRSVEETSATIIQYLFAHRERRQQEQAKRIAETGS